MGAEPFWLEPRQVVLKDGTVVTLRPEEKGDLEPVWAMFSTLSEESLQYLPIPITRERVEGWFREINYERALPILGLVEEKGEVRVIAASSLYFSQMEHNKHVTTFGITVHDDYQNLGLGKKITEYMIEIAREKGLKKVALEVVTHNSRAINVYRRYGFKIEGKLEMNHWNHVLKEYGDDYVMGLILEN
jgi:ribosomal protein S18 acetylase RimI-like enzyme